MLFDKAEQRETLFNAVTHFFELGKPLNAVAEVVLGRPGCSDEVLPGGAALPGATGSGGGAGGGGTVPPGDRFPTARHGAGFGAVQPGSYNQLRQQQLQQQWYGMGYGGESGMYPPGTMAIPNNQAALNKRSPEPLLRV